MQSFLMNTKKNLRYIMRVSFRFNISTSVVRKVNQKIASTFHVKTRYFLWSKFSQLQRRRKKRWKSSESFHDLFPRQKPPSLSSPPPPTNFFLLCLWMEESSIASRGGRLFNLTKISGDFCGIHLWCFKCWQNARKLVNLYGYMLCVRFVGLTHKLTF